MAGTRETFSITVDDAELRRYLAQLLDRLDQPAAALREIGEVLTASTQQRFATQTDPAGQPWAPNTPATLARKRTLRILTEHGFLGDTIRYQLAADGRSVAVGSGLVYAAMQQFGGTKSMWPHLWGDIPPRPFLGLSEADRVSVLEILRDYLSAP